MHLSAVKGNVKFLQYCNTPLITIFLTQLPKTHQSPTMAPKTCIGRLKPNDLFLTLLLESCLESLKMASKTC